MKQQILMANIAWLLQNWNDIRADHYLLLCHLNEADLKSWDLI